MQADNSIKTTGSDSGAGIVPPELLLTAGLLIVLGLITLVNVISALPDAFALLDSDFGSEFGLFTIAILAVAGFIGVSALMLARQVYVGDRVGQILTGCLSGALTLGFILADYRSGTDTAVGLCSMGVLAAVTLSPSARTFFRNHAGAEPAPVSAARALVVALAWIFALLGVAFLSLAGVDSTLGFVGAGLIAVSAVAYGMSKKLSTGDQSARVGVSLMMAAYVVLSFAAGDAAGDLVTPLALGATVAGLLWLPSTSRAFFEGSVPGRQSPVSTSQVRECPHCKEDMRRDASVCPHCRRESQAWQLHEGRWWYKRDDGAQFYLDERKKEWIRFPAAPP